MTKEQIRDAIVEIIGEILPDGNCSGLDPDKKLREQLELDSMDFLDIVMELRKKYRIEVPESDYGRLATLNSCMEYLEPKMKNI